MDIRRSGRFGHGRKWFRAMTGLALILVMILSVSITVAVSMLRIGFTPVLTDSMSPALKAGSVVVTRQKPTADLAVGDAVILPLPDGAGQRFLHRLIEVRHIGTQTHVRTKGDHNPLIDPWTLHVTSTTAPVAVASIPYIGWTTNILRWTVVRLLVAALVVALVVIGLVRIRRQVVGEKHRTNDESPSLNQA